jgi:AcrR family transcriptional regulator
MARPKSEDKRAAIMSSAARVIAAQGLGAATAGIARGAGVANGTLFNYFPTKAELLNALYLELKSEVAATLGLGSADDLRGQTFHAWSRWVAWGASHPDKHASLWLLEASNEVTPDSRAAAHALLQDVEDLIDRARAGGTLRDQPLSFVVAMVEQLAGVTMGFMARDPGGAEAYCGAAFETLWRGIAPPAQHEGVPNAR